MNKYIHQYWSFKKAILNNVQLIIFILLSLFNKLLQLILDIIILIWEKVSMETTLIIMTINDKGKKIFRMYRFSEKYICIKKSPTISNVLQ